jgi:hypothetical protein
MKHVANRRMALDASEADTDGANKMDHWTGLKQAFSDPKTYVLALSYHGIVGASGFQNVSAQFSSCMAEILTPHRLVLPNSCEDDTRHQ